jgi:hypothetical protein
MEAREWRWEWRQEVVVMEVSSSVVVSCLGRRAERALEGVQVLKLAGELTSAAVYALLATERQRAAG